jgi:hypothetical protein
MKIFLSWSGPHSRAVAEALKKVLYELFRNKVKPFYSPKIKRGVKWSVAIDAALQDTHFGIICMTPDSLDSRWIYYEAGALYKSQGSRIWTFLHKLEHEDVPSPLKDFQHTTAKRDDVLQLLKDINEQLRGTGSEALQLRVLRQRFNANWPLLKERLQAAEKRANPSHYDKAKEYDKFSDLGMETIHERLSDRDIKKLLQSARTIRVLKTWFPETHVIERGLSAAIRNHAKVRLLLCKPDSALLTQRAEGAHKPSDLGSKTVYHAIQTIYNLVEKTPGAKVRIACYDSWPGCPVIWYDKTILMGFYFRGDASPEWPWVSIRPNKYIATILEEQFDDLWKLADTEHLNTPGQMASWLQRNSRWAGGRPRSQRSDKRKKRR